MNRRYYTFSHYLKERFGGITWKIPVHAGFSCPNRDGRIGLNGCIYCNNNAFFYDADEESLSILEQVRRGRTTFRKQRGADQFMVYFQTYTNTYASIDELRCMWDDATSFDDIVALAVGTRPDCVNTEILDLLESYADPLDVWIEYGLQTIHDRTLNFINRGHTFADFQKAMALTRDRALLKCLHIIIGLPGESRADIMKTVDTVAQMDIDGIKIHPLQVIKGTELERMHHRFGINTYEMDEYVDLICDILERLPENIIIQRLVAESKPDLMVAPAWGVTKPVILKAIDRELEARDTHQGYLV